MIVCTEPSFSLYSLRPSIGPLKNLDPKLMAFCIMLPMTIPIATSIALRDPFTESAALENAPVSGFRLIPDAFALSPSIDLIEFVNPW